ncbi:MAG: hypothetical protein WCQ16_01210 [Verrucomicrobiae bacterium]
MKPSWGSFLCRTFHGLRLGFFLGLFFFASAATFIAAEEPPSVFSLVQGESLAEYGRLQNSLAAFKTLDAKKQADHGVLLSQAANKEAILAPSDRDPSDVVLRRTRALLTYLQGMKDARDLASEAQSLRALEELSAKTDVADAGARKALFSQAVTLRRQIAFANPLLAGIKDLLFLKRDPARDEHMCDQYYGFSAVKGGGLFVLKAPFSKDPQAVNLLENALCSNGRFQDRKLENGGFLSPSLSFDGKQILFAFTEADAKKGKWTPESTFHIFKVNRDGSSLTQLTDGPWNEFDPCWLPSGKIAFISERRGGFLRCSGARPCPNYTLHSMKADGSDIVCLSPHELHEWGPSVDNNGMIVFTRWDYIDRGANQAHHPWITTPDGRDPRSIHGNYAANPKDRPCMELGIRAIPGSRKLVAAAVAHHGQAYGSLITVDPSIPDDDKMAQVRRITPHARFPECEVGSNEHHFYATPWPLSEEFFLAVYSATPASEKYGIYLIDVFGNEELLYRDPRVSCLSPIPLLPRPMPPIIPEISPDPERPGMAKMGVVNVYNSRLPFPEGVKIKSLRILHTILKTTPVHHAPQIGYGCETPARAVLGTVPVEKDGSAYFEIPAGKAVFFQALDENGLAVQGMRSETWAQPGEMLTCSGCHDNRSQAISPRTGAPLAFKRAPSKVTPEPEGSNPFSFPRLVQPVLEKNCVACHQEDKTGKAPNLTKGDFMKDPFRWFASYRSLAPFAFHHGAARQDGYDLWTTPRTIPGKFGARASKLYQMLAAGHHDLKLPPEDLRRITLWLDSNSDFFGSYDNVEAQARGEIVKPSLE